MGCLFIFSSPDIHSVVLRLQCESVELRKRLQLVMNYGICIRQEKEKVISKHHLTNNSCCFVSCSIALN